MLYEYTSVKIIKDLKRQIAQNISAMVAPHMWKSAYLNDDGTPLKLFCFAPLYPNAVNDRDTRSMGKVHNGDLTCLQGFYQDEHGNCGVMDAFGGGCGCTSFISLCVEDLIAIESWLNKNFQKEIDRSRKHRLNRNR